MPVMGASPTAECSPGVEVVLLSNLSNLVAPVSTPVLCIVIFSMHIYTCLTHVIVKAKGGPKGSLGGAKQRLV